MRNTDPHETKESGAGGLRRPERRLKLTASGGCDILNGR